MRSHPQNYCRTLGHCPWQASAADHARVWVRARALKAAPCHGAAWSPPSRAQQTRPIPGLQFRAHG